MNHILKNISFIFHPLLMPLLGVIYYFFKTPRFIPKELIQPKCFAVLLLTIILPILLYFLLKTLGKVNSINLTTIQERKLPLAINACILFVLIKQVFPVNQIVVLHYFFIAILSTVLLCLVLVLLKFKASIHAMAIAGIVAFCYLLGHYFNLNNTLDLAILALLLGAILSSRLHLNAHTYKELLVGVLIGIVPQLLFYNFWS